MKNFILSLWGRYKRWQWNRKCIKYFGCKPETIYVSEEDYESLIEKLDAPPDPKTIESIRKILSRKSPWEE